ncbi:ATP-binding cassette domain-containing protein [Streptomyces chrestomyceticus]|uniref:ATP-binding cassette domain-containing protein n=1 Tax=Streptomyces chrestomyceticus TaxID=68185 RepID=UPI0036B25808
MHSTSHGAAVTATGYGLQGPRGWAFRDVGLAARPGSLIAVEGPSGSGRTCLLLALTGRMATTAGTAEVAGLPLPKKKAAVRAFTALAHVPGVTDLEPALTVAEHLRERVLLQRRFGDSATTTARGPLSALLRPRRERTAAARARIDAALEAAGLDLATLPKGDRTSVRDLERPEALRLSMALALIGRPRLLAVDDTDMKLSDAERADVWATLRSLAESGTTVLAVCSQAPDGAVVVRTAPRGGGRDSAATPGTDGTDGTGTRDDEKGAADALAEAGRA